MSQLSYFSLFTGGGGSCLGAKAAGLIPLGGVEIDTYPVALYNANFDHPVRHESILDTSIHELPDFDFLWASPPCPNFSTAKTDGGETPEDIAISIRVAEFIRLNRPRYFALENVRGYAGSESFAAILSRLDTEGYNYHWAIYDAADFGVSQNRNRLILRASRDPLGALLPTHSKYGGLWWQPWNGWYDAVADLLPNCRPSHLTERQILALDKKGWYGTARRCDVLAVMIDCKGNRHSSDYTNVEGSLPSFGIKASSVNQCRAVLIHGSTNEHRGIVRDKSDPSNTVTSNTERQITRAVILERVGYGKERDPTIRHADEPSITLRAHTGCDERGGFRSPLTALLENADIRALDYRCLARLQSFPDSYKWGNSSGKNCRVIGNAAPPLLAQRVIESMVKTQ